MSMLHFMNNNGKSLKFSNYTINLVFLLTSDKLCFSDKEVHTFRKNEIFQLGRSIPLHFLASTATTITAKYVCRLVI